MPISMNNRNTNIMLILVVTAILVAFYLYNETEKKEKRIRVLEEDKYRLLIDSLNRNPDLSDEIRKQLEELITQFENTDKRISNELAQALQLFQIGQHENAIEDLAKIMEYLLGKYYTNQNEYRTWLKKDKKQSTFHNLLIYCKEDKKIDDIEFHFFSGIKAIRNKEDHTLDFNLDEYLTLSGFIAALGGICKMASFVYPQCQKETEEVIFHLYISNPIK